MTEQICLDSFEEAQPDCECPLEVEVRVPNEYGGHYLRRKRWKTFREIEKAMNSHLNRIKCHSCGKEMPMPPRKGSKWWWDQIDKNCCSDPDWGESIGEYSSSGVFRNEDAEIAEPDEHVVEIVCHAHVGGNEGYYANLGVLLRKRFQNESRYVHLYHIKSFRGMAHVHDLVKRMMQATGVWPEWVGDQ